MAVGIRTYHSLNAELVMIALKGYGAKVGLWMNLNQAWVIDAHAWLL